MTINQMHRALKKVANISDFCRRHKLPRRSVMRWKLHDVEPRGPQGEALQKALQKDGLL